MRRARSHLPVHMNLRQYTGSHDRSAVADPLAWEDHRNRLPGRTAVLAPECRDAEYLEDARADAEDHSDYRVWNEGMNLADMECEHGRLPNDRIVSCSCWGLPIERMPEDLRERAVRSATEEPETALYKLV